ncbi:MAG: PD40 domain-containing protein, partial [Anaerolineae bacterium]|nr:PD40 domain-containing protein [Anaerolineae bacterium]
SSLEDTQTLRVWDRLSGEQVWRSSLGTVTDMAFSPDGTIVAIAEIAGMQLLDPTTLEQISRTLWVTPGSGEDVYTLAWSPDGRLLAFGSLFGTVRVWDYHAENFVAELAANDVQEIDYLRSTVRDVHFSPDSSRLASISADGTIRSWAVVTWQLIDDLALDMLNTAATWSPDGSSLAYGSDDGRIFVIGPFSDLSAFSAAPSMVLGVNNEAD